MDHNVSIRLMYLFKEVESSENSNYFTKWDCWHIDGVNFREHESAIDAAGFTTTLPEQSRYLTLYEEWLWNNASDVVAVREKNGLCTYRNTLHKDNSLSFMQHCVPVNRKKELRRVNVNLGRDAVTKEKILPIVVYRADAVTQTTGEIISEFGELNGDDLILNVTNNRWGWDTARDGYLVGDDIHGGTIIEYLTAPLTMAFSDFNDYSTPQAGVGVTTTKCGQNIKIPANAVIHSGITIDGRVYWQTSKNFRPLLEEDFIYDFRQEIVYIYKNGAAEPYSQMGLKVFEGMTTYICMDDDLEPTYGLRYGIVDRMTHDALSKVSDDILSKFTKMESISGSVYYKLTGSLNAQEQKEFILLTDQMMDDISESEGEWAISMSTF